MEFSIVIPCFNRPLLLHRALMSCVAQSYSNFEVVVIDDGSTDDIKGVVEEIEDRRIRYFRQKNSGGCVARNFGISVSKGEWIALLDADDYFVHNKLEVLKREIAQCEADMYFSRAAIDRGIGSKVNTPGQQWDGKQHLTEFMFKWYQVIPTSTFVIRRQLASRIRFQESLKIGQDIDYIIRLFGSGVSMRMIPDVLVVYDDAGGSERVSRGVHGDSLNSWLTQNRCYFSEQGYYSYRASYLSKINARRMKCATFVDLVNGYKRGGMSLMLVIRRGVRAYFPRFYNYLVKIYLLLRKATN